MTKPVTPELLDEALVEVIGPVLETAILSRLNRNRIEGFTLEMSREDCPRCSRHIRSRSGGGGLI